MDFVFFVHYLIIALIVVLPACAVAWGQSIVAKAAVDAFNEQPAAAADISRMFFLSIFINETVAVISGLVGIMLIMQPVADVTLPVLCAELGIFCAVAIPSFLTGTLASFPGQQAVGAIARQPLFAKSIQNITMITMSFMQTSAILGLIITVVIRNQLSALVTLDDGLRLLATGLAFGLGTIGPLVGLSYFARVACRMVGVNRDAYAQIFSFTFIGQALIETPVLFALVLAGAIMFRTSTSGIVLIASAIAMGLSTLGPGIASGKIASAACAEIGHDPAQYALLSRTSMLAQTLVDASVIYGALIAGAILFM